MWRRVERADIDQARNSLGHCLAKTLKRHAKEINSLRAKHADEIHVLEAKQIELNTLDAMIDRVAAESLSTAEKAPDQNSPNAPDGGDEPLIQEGDNLPELASSLPERLTVRYVVPNFRPFRRFGSSARMQV